MSRSVIFVFAAAVLWGTTGTAAFFMGPSVSPVAIGAATMGLGGVVLALIGGRGSLRVFADTRSRTWLVLGIVGVIAYPLTFYWGMSLAGIALGNVVALGLGPITVAALEWAVDRSKPQQIWWWSSGLALAGIAVMSTAKVELGGGRPGNVSAGIALALAAGLSYGLYTYCFGRLIDRGHSPLAVIGAVFGGGSPVLLGVLAFTGAGLVATASQGGLISYLVLGPMVLAYIAFSAALRRLRSSTVASVALVEPVVAAVMAVLVAGERLGSLAILGGVAVIVAIAFLGRNSGERPAPERTYS